MKSINSLYLIIRYFVLCQCVFCSCFLAFFPWV